MQWPDLAKDKSWILKWGERWHNQCCSSKSVYEIGWTSHLTVMNFKACGSGCPIFRLGTP
jgi:hypothetical protein